MRKIIQMARLELAVLFYSPIAWLLLMIFVIQCGIAYTDMLYRMETDQQLSRSLPQLTRALFSGDTGVLTQISQSLYLYIPLLTMSVISRELGSGSIKLIQSSPITNFQVVMGKFIGVMGYGLLLCSVVLVCMLMASFSVTSLDFGFVIGGVFGLLLLLSAYAAIGLFMSSLTSYPIVAAISTLATLAALNYIGLLGQTVDGLREVTHWISLKGKIDGIINGLLTTRELSYFFAVTAFFLVLTMLKLSAGRIRRSLGVRVATIGGLVVALVLVIFVSSRPGNIHYWDTTRTKDQTLSTKSQKLLAPIDDSDVRLVTYTNLLDHKVVYGEPVNLIKDRLNFERYQRFLPRMKMEYVVYYDSVPNMRDTVSSLVDQARNVAKVKGFNMDKVLSPEEIRKRIDLSGENNGFVRMLEYDGKRTPLRMFDDMIQYPRESEGMAAFKRLVDSAATVWILAGHGERSIYRMDNSNYQIAANGNTIRSSLLNQGFDTRPVNLDSIERIPLEISTLIIADPMELYDEATLGKIESYIDAGGNLLLTGEPGRQGIFNAIAAKLGVQLQDGTVMQESAYYDADLVYSVLSTEADSIGFGLFERARISMPHSAALEFSNSAVAHDNATPFRVTTILQSDLASSWKRLAPYDLANEKVHFDPATEKKAQLPLLAALSRDFNGREQRIIVSGDSDFMNNQEIVRFGVQNASFIISKMFRWFSDGEFPYSPNGENAPDRVVKVDRSQINLQKIILFAILPLLLVASGAIVLIRRRRV